MLEMMTLLKLDNQLTCLSQSAHQLKTALVRRSSLSGVVLEYQIAVQAIKTVEISKRRVRSTTLQSESYSASWILGQRKQISDAVAQAQRVVDNRLGAMTAPEGSR